MKKPINKDLMTDAVGKIDPSYIEDFEMMDAQLGAKPSGKRRNLRALLISAACLALGVVILLGSMPVTYAVHYESINATVTQTVDRVIFTEETDEQGNVIYAPWVEWGVTEAFFNALGAGTENSAINAMKENSSEGLIGDASMDLALFLERLYEYYLQNKDYVDGVIDELENELDVTLDIDDILPPSEDTLEEKTQSSVIEPHPTEEDVTESLIKDVTEPTEIETDPIEDTTPIEGETEPKEEVPEEIFVIYEPMNLKLLQMDDHGIYYVVCGFHNADRVIEDLIIPEEVEGIPVREIGENAFLRQKAIKTLVLPSTLETIAYQAFSGCSSLASVEIPASVTIIAESAFTNCGILQHVTFAPNSKLRTIGNYAFQNTGLESITLPSGLKTIGDHAFEFCYQLKQIVIPETVTSVGACSFMYCTSMESVTILKGAKTQIHDRAFSRCSALVDVDLGNTYLISTRVFENCDALKSIIIPASVTTICNSAFRNCDALEEVSFETSNGQLMIHGYAFAECINLKKISFPAHLTSMLDFVLRGSESIEQIVLLNPTAKYDKNSLYLNNYSYSKHTITFNGTIEQWKALGLNGTLGSYNTIICKDGYVGVKPE